MQAKAIGLDPDIIDKMQQVLCDVSIPMPLPMPEPKTPSVVGWKTQEYGSSRILSPYLTGKEKEQATCIDAQYMLQDCINKTLKDHVFVTQDGRLEQQNVGALKFDWKYFKDRGTRFDDPGMREKTLRIKVNSHVGFLSEGR